jgi:hypothetical protein
MGKCPLNMNNGFDNILFKLNLLNKDSMTLNKDRKNLFYFTCIPLRIVIAGVLLYLHLSKRDLCFFAILATFLTLIHLLLKEFSNNDCKQWWSNKFEIFLSFIAFILSVYCYFYNKEYCMLYLSIIVIISVIAGIIQSLIINPFD